jgi:hypothetical protein
VAVSDKMAFNFFMGYSDSSSSSNEDEDEDYLEPARLNMFNVKECNYKAKFRMDKYVIILYVVTVHQVEELCLETQKHYCTLLSVPVL